MTAWLNKAFFERVEHRKGMFRKEPQSLDGLPDAVAAIVAKSRGLGVRFGPADHVVVSLPWDCEEASELHAAGFSPEYEVDGLYIGEQDWCWRASAQPLRPRLFNLTRYRDETGISGTGKVAEGVLFGDGTCVLRWCTSTRSTGIYSTLGDLVRIHGHNGATVVQFNGV